MWLSTLLNLLGGTNVALAAVAAPAPGSGDVSNSCSAHTVTVTETVTPSPEVFVISVVSAEAAVSNMLHGYPQQAIAVTSTAGIEATITVTETIQTTKTITLDSVTSPAEISTASASSVLFVTDVVVTTELVTETISRNSYSVPQDSPSSVAELYTTVVLTKVNTITLTNTLGVNNTAANAATGISAAFQTGGAAIPVNPSHSYIFGSAAASYASSLSKLEIKKRGVCDLVTATLADGTPITFPNAWDGQTYVPTCKITPISSSESTSVPASTSSSDTYSAPDNYAPSYSNPAAAPPDELPSSTLTSAVSTEPSAEPSVTIQTVSPSVPLVQITYATSSSSSSYVVPTFPSSNIVRSSASSQSSWNSTATYTTTVQSSVTTHVTAHLTASSAAPAVATQTSCGEIGTFQITFQDLPVNSANNNDTADFPPIFAPYRHFFWSPGWTYVPPPTDPYLPQNGDRLGMYIPPTAPSATSSSANITGGWFGAINSLASTVYRFGANVAWVGCENGFTADATDNCTVSAFGYRYDAQGQVLLNVASYSWTIPPCKTNTGCQLQPIIFDDQFYSVSILSFQAQVNQKDVFLYLDTFVGVWNNNTCSAGQQRAKSR